jgi:hypothetical protein
MDWLAVLEQSDLTAYLRASPWAVPLLQMLHLLGLVLLVGGAGSFDLRLLRRKTAIDLPAFAGLVLPWAWAGFAVVVLSGSLLFMASPLEMVLNNAFRWKMVLIAGAGANALLFQRVLYPRVLRGGFRWGQIAALVSLALWCAVIVLGRLITYV